MNHFIHTIRLILFRILKKYPRILAWNYLYRTASKTITFTRNKTVWTASARDGIIGYGLFVYGHWQFQEIDSVVDLLERRSLLSGKQYVINAGANIGSSSIRISKLCACRVLAIEPIAANFELLKKNIAQNNLTDRIDCFQGAVFEEVKNLTMVTPEINPGGSEIYSDMCDYAEGRVSRENVSGFPLSHILRERKIDPKSVAFVWSDTQGSEGHVIRTGSELWLAGVPLVVEYWPRGLCYQGEKEFLQLVRRYFKSYCPIPNYRSKFKVLKEEPIETLGTDKLDQADDMDILLLP